MSGELANREEPCGSCPYRRDCPSGVWHPEEYQKLLAYDEGAEEPAFGVFMCHHSPVTGRETVCRGWLTVHDDSVAVRLALLMGKLTPEAVAAEVRTPLWRSGREAAEHGLREVDRPAAAARNLIDKLTAARRRGRRGR